MKPGIDRDNWYPEQGKARSDDVETSQENARAQTAPKIRATHTRALRALYLRGGAGTAPQVLPLNQQTRMEELRRAGLVERTEKKDGRAFVHRLTSEGERIARAAA